MTPESWSTSTRNCCGAAIIAHHGAEPGHRCRPLHINRVRKLHYVLSSAFRRAVRWDWIDHSPTPEVDLPSQPLPEPQPPTVAEAKRLGVVPTSLHVTAEHAG